MSLTSEAWRTGWIGYSTSRQEGYAETALFLMKDLWEQIGCPQEIESLRGEFQENLQRRVTTALHRWVEEEATQAVAELRQIVENREQFWETWSSQVEKQKGVPTQEQQKAIFSTLAPGPLVIELRTAAQFHKRLADTYEHKLRRLQAHPSLGPLVRRYHLPAAAVSALAMGCNRKLKPALQALHNHAKQIKAHQALIRTVVAERRAQAGVTLVASIVGSMFFGPLGGLGARALVNTEDNAEARLETSSNLIWETMNAFVDQLRQGIDGVAAGVHHVLLALYGGLVLRLEKDLNSVGRSLVGVSFVRGNLRIGLNATAQRAFSQWAENTLQGFEGLRGAKEWGKLGDAADKALRTTIAEPLHSRVLAEDGFSSYAVLFARARVTALNLAANEMWSEGRVDTACALYRHLYSGSSIAWLSFLATEPDLDGAWMHVGGLRLALAATSPRLASTKDSAGGIFDLETLVVFVAIYGARSKKRDSCLPGEGIDADTEVTALAIDAYRSACAGRSQPGLQTVPLSYSKVNLDPKLRGPFVQTDGKKLSALEWVLNQAAEYSGKQTPDSDLLLWLTRAVKQIQRRRRVTRYALAVFLLLLSIGAYFYWPTGNQEGSGGRTKSSAILKENATPTLDAVPQEKPPDLTVRSASEVTDAAAQDARALDANDAAPAPNIPLPLATIKVKKARLRLGPGTDHKVVTVLPEGAMVYVIGSVDNWRKVQTRSGTSAWISSDLLDTAPGRQPVQVTARRLVEVAVPHAVVRKGPGKEHEKTGVVLREGTRHSLVTEKDGWMLVESGGGEIGWVHGRLLEPVEK